MADVSVNVGCVKQFHLHFLMIRLIVISYAHTEFNCFIMLIDPSLISYVASCYGMYMRKSTAVGVGNTQNAVHVSIL